jgi:uncharacterized protein DUF3800
MGARVKTLLHHAPVSLWGRKWKEIQLAFITAFLDDSGTAPEQRIAICSAILIPANQIEALERQWKIFTEKNGFLDFHASECAARNYKSQYAGWDDKKVRKIFLRVRQFCKRFGVQTYGFAVHKKSFEEEIPAILRENIGSHYTWAVRQVVTSIETWRRIRKIKQQIQYIYDWEDIGSQERFEIDEVMGQSGEQLNEKPQHDYKERKKIPALQCADFMAWLSFQLGNDNFYQVPLNSLAVEALRDLENYYPAGKCLRFKKWFQVRTIQRAELRLWASKEANNPQTIKHFADWRKRHPKPVKGKNGKKQGIR